jgi:hypothetical protein
MKIQLLISAAIIALTANINLPAFARTPLENSAVKKELIANANKTEKIRNIKRLLEITGAKAMNEQMLTQMLNAIQNQYPNVPEQFWDTFAAEINVDDLINEYIPLYDKYFTNEEITGMIAFYETPLGKKTLNVLPQITQDSMEIGIKYGRQAAQKAIQKLQAEGYIR